MTERTAQLVIASSTCLVTFLAVANARSSKRQREAWEQYRGPRSLKASARPQSGERAAPEQPHLRSGVWRPISPYFRYPSPASPINRVQVLLFSLSPHEMIHSRPQVFFCSQVSPFAFYYLPVLTFSVFLSPSQKPSTSQPFCFFLSPRAHLFIFSHSFQ